MSILDFFERLPGKLFPALEPTMVNGILVFPYKYIREIFHIAGAIVIIGISHILFTLKYKYAPLVFFIALGIWMTYQEFYLHVQKYNQPIGEGLLDWASWMVPFSIYLVIIYKHKK